MAILRRGSKGDAVTDLQTSLQALSVDCDIDGEFGAKTEAAVKHFQLAYALDADGVAGPTTLKKLEEEVANLEGGGSSSDEQATS